MIKNLKIVLPAEFAKDKTSITTYIAQTQAINQNDIKHLKINKRSIDARSKIIKVNLDVDVYINEDPDLTNSGILLPEYKNVANAKPVHIIGAGPAGLFAALKLIELGLKPIIFERGKNVQDRRRDLAAINRLHIVNPDSNYCFGEGGAGTYSDGKLYTRSQKRGSIKKILDVLVANGADSSILTEAHPHIGTNKLPKIIATIRELILHYGGEVHFNKKLIDFTVTNASISSLIIEDLLTNTKKEHSVNSVILATGHSSRDIFYLLHEKGIAIEAKEFALGVRIEHPQEIIDKALYHCTNSTELRQLREYLPAAAYSWVEQVNDIGVYSFCMCPGGIIAPCATNAGEIVTNGWSPSKRNNPYANSGIVTTITEKDYSFLKSKDKPLAALDFQKHVEHNAFMHTAQNQTAPAQRLIDFCTNKLSSDLPDCSYQPGIQSKELKTILTSAIAQRLQKGFLQFAKRNKYYYTNEAVLVAPESRTSSPIRIPRDREKLHHTQLTNLFPCGEGAGYAGGIMSACIDGENCAVAIAKT